MSKSKYERAKKPYTQEEIEYLEANVGIVSFVRMAKELKRSPVGIERKLATMGMYNTKMEGGVISLYEFQRAIHSHTNTIMRWKKDYKLPLHTRNLRHGKDKQHTWAIIPEAFWKWAEKHKDVVNWLKYERGSLIPEPDWLEEEIRKRYKSTPRKAFIPWTPAEDRYMWDAFYKESKTQAQIGKELDRTANSVEKRLKRLRDKGFK